MEADRDWGILFNGFQFSKMESALEMGGGDEHESYGHLVSVNPTLKRGYDSRFHVTCVLPGARSGKERLLTVARLVSGRWRLESRFSDPKAGIAATAMGHFSGCTSQAPPLQPCILLSSTEPDVTYQLHLSSRRGF